MKKDVNPITNTFKTEWQHLGKRKKMFIFYTTLFFIAGVIDLMHPLIVGLIFNKVQDQITSEAELTSLIYIIFLLLGINIVFWLIHGFARVQEQKTGFFVNRDYINSKIEKVLELPIKWHKDNHSGSTIDKINRGGSAISSFSRNTTFDIFYGIVNLFGSVIILLFFDTRAAILALLFSIITLYFVYKIDLRLNKQYKEINNYGNKAAAKIYDYISNIITIITLRLKPTVKKEIDDSIMASYKVEKKNIFLNELKWGTASIAISLMTVIVLSLKAYTDYHLNGIIKIGTLYILYGYLAQVGQTFYRFASLYGSIVRYSSQIENARQIDEEFDKVKIESFDNLPSNWQEIEIKNISFNHNKKQAKLHIDNANIKFRKGQRIAFIGTSGSGKSTMLALLRGLVKPESGKVIVNGKYLDEGLDKIRNTITLIPQDPEIFNNSIEYNITMGSSTEKKDLDKAIAMAQFKEVINRLSKGIQTNVLEKGVSLSGGEKQRLALARGLLAAKDSEIVLMDEPTSSVDTLNEIKIYDQIIKEFKDKTIISALHKLHLLKKFDYIYIFDKGKIIAEGTLSELKNKPIFARIWEKYNSK
ncbi:ABC transporter ATP-binding protein [Candidatus Pacearchaeota archaeon]|nr:ABC transporter ATP-binding protein [Candidatus Pacearchaeota archaeon]